MALSPRMAVFTIVGAAAYLALAVAGEGGLARFASHPALIALGVVTLAAAVAGLFTKGNVSSGVREDRGNRWVLVAFTVLGLALGYLPALDDRLELLTFGGEALRWFGVALYAAGGRTAHRPGVRARQAVQRPRRAAGGAQAENRRALPPHPQSELPRAARR